MTTVYRSAYELHDAVLRGVVPIEADLRALLDAPKPVSAEGQYHDYKHADVLTDRRKGAEVLREYAAAFANAEGGVLIVGVDNSDNRNWTSIDDKKFGPGGVKEWAEKHLNDLASSHGLNYRVVVVALSDGVVLLVAVARGLTLVPLYDGKRPTYVFRFAHENRAIPDFLVSDLVLGRRRTPTVALKAQDWRIQVEKHTSVVRKAEGGESTNITEALVVGGSVVLTNNSLVTATDLVAGLVTYSAKERGEQTEPVLPDDLLARVDLLPHPVLTSHPYALHHARFQFAAAQPGERPRQSISLKPFDQQAAHMNFQWRVETRAPSKAECIAAVYIVPEGCEPLWFEARLSLYEVASNRLANSMADVRFVRVFGRPRIGIAVSSDTA